MKEEKETFYSEQIKILWHRYHEEDLKEAVYIKGDKLNYDPSF